MKSCTLLMYLRPLCILLCLCGLELTAVAQPLPALIPYSDGAKWGYADTTGRVVITPQWEAVNFFEGDRARVFFYKHPYAVHGTVHCVIDRLGRYLVADNNGAVVLRLQGWYNPVRKDGYWYLRGERQSPVLNKSFEEIVSDGYTIAELISRRLFVVSQHGKVGIINEQGKWVTPPRSAQGRGRLLPGAGRLPNRRKN